MSTSPLHHQRPGCNQAHTLPPMLQPSRLPPPASPSPTSTFPSPPHPLSDHANSLVKDSRLCRSHKNNKNPHSSYAPKASHIQHGSTFLARHGRPGQPNCEAIRAALLPDFRHKSSCPRCPLRQTPSLPFFPVAPFGVAHLTCCARLAIAVYAHTEL